MNSPRAAELLSPAGDAESLRAAVDAGADAVYLGLTEFSARARAANFSVDDLGGVMDSLRSRGVRGYVAMNTLLLPEELDRAARLLRACAEAGVDALIVQDLGLARLARRMVPALPLHASTQATLPDAGGIGLLDGLVGIERVILPRELSLGQVRALAARTRVELEVFVHGALCLSYGGQCLASAAIGGRSANRGECAQPCRLPYSVLVDRGPAAKAPPFPLSPLDLCAWRAVPDLVRAGVRALKIEGRLKNARYVGAVTSFYRKALDAALEGRRFEPSAKELSVLSQSFSRGFTRGFLGGAEGGELVEGSSPKSRGLRVGLVTGTTARGVLVRLDSPVKPGDGVVFEARQPGGREQGGRVYHVEPRPGKVVELSFGRDALVPSQVRHGSAVYKTDDPSLRAEPARPAPRRAEPLSAEVHARLGGELSLVLRDPSMREARASWQGPLERALKHPLDEALLKEQLGKLGGTPFSLGSVSLDSPEPVIVPKSVLNELRRQAVDELLRLRRESARKTVAEPEALERLRAELPVHEPPGPAALHVLVRHPGQLPPLKGWNRPDGLDGQGLVYLDLPDLRQLHGAARLAESMGLRWALATPRILEPGEESWLKSALSLKPFAVLARNLAAVAFFKEHGVELVGDQGLNAANELSAASLLELGLSRLTPAFELRGDTLSDLIRRFPGRLEMPVLRHVEMFHSKHCLFSGLLAGGKPCAACGKPCHSAELELRDRKGAVHAVRRDALKRCSVFSGKVEDSLSRLPELKALGVRHFRLELLDETPEELHALLGRLGSSVR